jgi:hypothetical protein
MIAESVFSPNDAEPAPMTVIFVGTDMCILQLVIAACLIKNLTFYIPCTMKINSSQVTYSAFGN